MRLSGWARGPFVAAAVSLGMILGGCGAANGNGPDGQTAAGGATAAATTAGVSGSATRAAARGLLPTGVARTDFGLGMCEATISGGVTATIRSGGDGGAVNSEYWFTDAELLDVGRQLGEDDAAMRVRLAAGEFVFYPLVLNCGDTRTGIAFLPAATRHEQFPFGPGSYRLVGGRAADGEVSAAVSLNGASYRATSGSFEVQRFDRSVFAGTFQLEAEEQRASSNPKRVSISGRFEMKCTGASTREGCAR